jgi:hypothetical protein
VGDLIDTLMYHCPNYCFEVDKSSIIPQDLWNEAEGEQSKNNSEILEQFLNQQLFTDPQVVCSSGMRQYFNSFAIENTGDIRSSHDIFRRLQFSEIMAKDSNKPNYRLSDH